MSVRSDVEFLETLGSDIGRFGDRSEDGFLWK